MKWTAGTCEKVDNSKTCILRACYQILPIGAWGYQACKNIAPDNIRHERRQWKGQYLPTLAVYHFTVQHRNQTAGKGQRIPFDRKLLAHRVISAFERSENILLEQLKDNLHLTWIKELAPNKDKKILHHCKDKTEQNELEQRDAFTKVEGTGPRTQTISTVPPNRYD